MTTSRPFTPRATCASRSRPISRTTTKGYVDGPFGQIHYQTLGSGPPLVLLHQSPSSSEMFRAAYALLAEHGIAVVGIDTPGYGMSAPPPHPPSIADYAMAISEALYALKLTPTALLGHHTGAAIAAELAAGNPEAVNKIILNGPPVMTDQERDDYRQALEDAPKFAPVPDGSHLQALWDRRVLFTPGWTNLDAMHWGIVQMLLAGDTDWYGHNAAFGHDISEPLAAIKCPGLILTNTGDDIYYAAGRAQELRPDFDYVELEGGTHDIVDEQPQAWSEAVAQFVLA